MTKEEIEKLPGIIAMMHISESVTVHTNEKIHEKLTEVCNLAIKALEQEPIIDKIRDELIQSIQNGTIKIESGNEELFRIIDKYKAETEADNADSN